MLNFGNQPSFTGNYRQLFTIYACRRYNPKTKFQLFESKQIIESGILNP